MKFYDCYKNKNLSALKNISNDLFKMSEYLLQCIGNVDEKIDLKKYKFPINIKSEIIALYLKLKKLKMNLLNMNIIDPLKLMSLVTIGVFVLKSTRKL